VDPKSPRSLIAWCLLGAACPACLILDPVDFPARDNHSPAIESTLPPANEFKTVDRTALETEEFVATVFDEDREDVLDARAFIDWNAGDTGVVFPEVRTDEDGAGRRRVVTARFRPSRDFARGCHVVEVDVVDDASGWATTGPRDVQEGVGKVTAIWWVLAHDGEDEPDIAAITCRGADPGAASDGVSQ
jgi:hypothetical protein